MLIPIESLDDGEFKDALVLPNDEQKIWKFMDFTKFCSLLLDQSLYFSRLDQFEDTYEGFSSDSYIEIKCRDNIANNKFPLTNENVEYVKNLYGIYTRFLRKTSFACCFHINNIESAALWKLYSKTNESVAIQTTVGRLKLCLEKNPKCKIHLGKVIYDESQVKKELIDDKIYRFFIKRKSFECDRELRAIIQNSFTIDEYLKNNNPKSIGFNENNNFLQNPSIEDLLKIDTLYQDGIQVKVNLNELIEIVYIAPNAPKYPRFPEICNE
nr:hypothetical protein [uncultured Methanospirillum sp.]